MLLNLNLNQTFSALQVYQIFSTLTIMLNQKILEACFTWTYTFGTKFRRTCHSRVGYDSTCTGEIHH